MCGNEEEEEGGGGGGGRTEEGRRIGEEEEEVKEEKEEMASVNQKKACHLTFSAPNEKIKTHKNDRNERLID